VGTLRLLANDILFNSLGLDDLRNCLNRGQRARNPHR